MIRLTTFGGLSVNRTDGRTPTSTSTQPRRLALLAIVARAGSRGVSRERLMALLWPEVTDEDAARKRVSQAIYGLRTGLDEDELFVGLQELKLNPEVVSSDLGDFERAVAEGDLDAAARLVTGRFLEDFRVPDAPAFERWRDEQEASLTRAHRDVLLALVERAKDQGDPAALVSALKPLAAADPHDSDIALALMQALAANGDRAGAIRHGEIHRALLAQDDEEPSPAIGALVEQLRASPPAAQAARVERATSATTTPVSPGVIPPGVIPPEIAPPPLRITLPDKPIEPVTVDDANRDAPTAARRTSFVPWLIAGATVVIGLAAVQLLYRNDGNAPAATLEAPLGTPERVTNEDALEIDPAISPDGKQVAYAAGSEGAMRLYVRQRSGSSAVPVSNNAPGADHRHPQWSPDGTQLLFQAERGIWMIPALGGTARQVVAPPSGDAVALGVTWSPDAKQLAWVERDTIRIRALDGGAVRNVAWVDAGHSLSWSPDGRWLAVVTGNPYFTYGRSSWGNGRVSRLGNRAPSTVLVVSAQCTTNAASCTPHAITTNNTLNTSPDWLDSTRVVYVALSGGVRDIFLATIDRQGHRVGDPTRLTVGLDVHGVSAAGDGRTLSYSVLQQRTNVWQLPLTAPWPLSLAAAVRVTRGTQTVEGVSVSPDGKWLAFDASRDGQQDLFRVPLRDDSLSTTPSGEPQRIITSAQDDFHPSWSPDARWLSFYTFVDGVRRSATVDVEKGEVHLVHTGVAGEEHSPVFTPNGNTLVYYRTAARHSAARLFASTRTSDTTFGAEREIASGVEPSIASTGDVAYMGTDGSVRVLPPSLDERGSRELLAASNSAGIQAASARITPRGDAVLIKGFDRVGDALWSVPTTGGAPRLVLRFNDVDRPSARSEFATDGRRLFFTLTESSADIWTVQLNRR